MINAVTNSAVPHLTVNMARSFGAGQLRDVRPGLRPAVPVRVAEREARGDGRRAARRGAVDRRPGVGRGAGRAVRRGRRPRAARPPSRSRSRPSPTRSSSPAGSTTTASSTPATPARCSASRCRPSTRRPSPGAAASASSGCEADDHTSCWSPTAGEIAAPRHPHRPRAGHRHRRRVLRRRRRRCRTSRAADEAVRLPGAAPADTYLRGDLLIAAARATGADAVHPGYGFLSENAGFARDCAAAGLTFVGPSPEAIAAMGSKIEAKALMAAAGVPDAARRRRSTPGADLGAPTAAGIGFPVLVKAAFGGGGRGMRIVATPDELAEAVASARREAASAFGDGTVFLERYVVDPRHVEVQIFGDAHGSVVAPVRARVLDPAPPPEDHRGGPSPASTTRCAASSSAAAVAAGKAIGYVGAGTVEFVMDADRRVLVPRGEHPAAGRAPGHRAASPGLDLVALQLRVAEGEPLPAEVTEARIDGHAIEARLYAEDVPAGFLPATGTLHRFRVPDGRVRVDAGVADGSVVGAALRPDAGQGDRARRHPGRRGPPPARGRLRGAQIHGVVTNRDLLVGDPRATPSSWRVATSGSPPLVRETTAWHSIPLAGGRGRAGGGGGSPQRASRRAGATSPPTPTVRATRWTGRRSRSPTGSGATASRSSSTASRSPSRWCRRAPERVVLDVDGVRRAFAVHRTDAAVYVDDAAGSAALARVPRFPDPNAHSARRIAAGADARRGACGWRPRWARRSRPGSRSSCWRR